MDHPGTHSAHTLRVQERAYALWQQDDCQWGRDLDYWIQAEAQIAAEDALALSADPPLPETKSSKKPRTPRVTKLKA